MSEGPIYTITLDRLSGTGTPSAWSVRVQDVTGRVLTHAMGTPDVVFAALSVVLAAIHSEAAPLGS